MTAGLLEPHVCLQRFQELCVRYANLMNSAGLEIAAYDPETIGSFKSKSAAVRQRQIEALSVDILILESMLAEDVSLRDSRTHVSRFVSMMGFEAQPDIFEKIEPDDSVEVYLSEAGLQHQIFRNLRYFEMTSFTIEQLFAMDWKISYIHEPEFVTDIMEALNHCLSSPRISTVAYHPRLHVLTEIGSRRSRTFSTTMKYLSPLIRDGQIKAFITTNRSRILASTT